VTASRGKVVRAEPFSALYEEGKVRHAGRFVELEDELTAFSTYGYTGSGSPNRADALIWALTELFPGMMRSTTPQPEAVAYDGGSWMG
jgi:phage terminase large subunit-like protein